MNRQTVARMVSVLIAGAVLFGLEQGYGVAFYIAIPVAIVVYTAIKLVFALTLEANDPAP